MKKDDHYIKLPYALRDLEAYFMDDISLAEQIKMQKEMVQHPLCIELLDFLDILREEHGDISQIIQQMDEQMLEWERYASPAEEQTEEITAGAVSDGNYAPAAAGTVNRQSRIR